MAYEFGSSFLAPDPPFGAGQPKSAIDLMNYGIQNNPDNWKLYYDLGFVYFHGTEGLQECLPRLSRADRGFRTLIPS